MVTLESGSDVPATMVDQIFSLPAGTYRINWRCPAHDAANVRTQLVHDTDITFPSGSSNRTEILGESGYSDTADPGESNYYSCGSHIITTSQKEYFVIQQYQDAGNWGQASQIGNHEIYTQIFVEDLKTAVKDQTPAGSNVPIGGIIMYSGTDTELNALTNWKLCDGTTYGSVTTPNLKDRFVIGADQYSNGKWRTNVSGTLKGKGGAATDTVTISGSDTVTISDSPSTLTGDITFGVNGTGSYSSGGAKSITVNVSGSDTVNISGSDTVNTLPPYFALAYIMRIS